MALWLFKEEPDHYHYTDLERDGEAVWDGVNNALARNYLRQVQGGDRVLYYHTGKEKAIVGEMEVMAVEEGTGKVTVKPSRRWPKPLTLARIKADPALADWELVRLPRLSVLPVTEEQWRRLGELCRE